MGETKKSKIKMVVYHVSSFAHLTFLISFHIYEHNKLNRLWQHKNRRFYFCDGIHDCFLCLFILPHLLNWRFSDQYWAKGLYPYGLADGMSFQSTSHLQARNGGCLGNRN